MSMLFPFWFHPFSSLFFFLFFLPFANGQVSLPEAVDYPSTFTTGGAAPWYGQTGKSWQGGDAAQSGAITHFQETWMETKIDGPKRIKFFWNVSSEINQDLLEFLIDGQVKASISGPELVEWRPAWFVLPNRTGIPLRWRYSKDDAGSANPDCGWVDALSVSDLISLPVALDAPSLSFSTGSSDLTKVWSGQTEMFVAGASAAQSGKLGPNEESWMSTTIQGPKDVRFSWQASSENYYDILEFSIDNQLQRWIGGRRPSYLWESFWCLLPEAKSYVFKWRYSKDAHIDGEQDCGWVDCIKEFTPLPLPQALDQETMVFSTGGSKPFLRWSGQTETYCQGGDAAQSGRIFNNEETWMETSISGPVNCSFYWKVSSEEGCDFLEFYVDEVKQQAISGQVGWTQVTHVLPDAKAYSLRWRYAKDSRYAIEMDAGWVDGIEIKEAIPPAISSASTVLKGVLSGLAPFSVTVGGQPAQVSGTTWSKQVTLNPGANTFIIKVIDGTGLESQHTLSIPK
jgi:hypothetical protein